MGRDELCLSPLLPSQKWSSRTWGVSSGCRHALSERWYFFSRTAVQILDLFPARLEEHNDLAVYFPSRSTWPRLSFPALRSKTRAETPVRSNRSAGGCGYFRAQSQCAPAPSGSWTFYGEIEKISVRVRRVSWGCSKAPVTTSNTLFSYNAVFFHFPELSATPYFPQPSRRRGAVAFPC